MIVCLTPPQINDFGDLLGTPYAPVSKIAPVKYSLHFMRQAQKCKTCQVLSNLDLDNYISIYNTLMPTLKSRMK